MLIFFLIFFQFSGMFSLEFCTMNRNYFRYDKNNMKVFFFTKNILVNILK